jgi:CrcB protein
MAVWMKLLYFSLAGAFGTLVRYGVGSVVQSVAGIGFPWNTLVVNVTGCFLFGFVTSLSGEKMVIRLEAREVILVGFMGAYTTFSTFAFETGDMLEKGQYLWAGANLVAQNVVGIAFLLIGLAAGRALVRV